MLRLRRRGIAPAGQRGALALAEQQADRAADRERQLRTHQQQRAGWLEANADLGPAYRQVVRELAWRRRVAGLAAEQEPSAHLRDLLGPVPESTRGRRAWRQAAAHVQEYRTTYHLHDAERALGPEPREPAQRAAWRQAHAAVERIWHKQRTAERAHTTRDGRSDRPSQLRSLPQPGGAGPERAAG
jgi:hypothetical protein